MKECLWGRQQSLAVLVIACPQSAACACPFGAARVVPHLRSKGPLSRIHYALGTPRAPRCVFVCMLGAPVVELSV